MTTKRFDVAVVGNVGIDTNVYLHGDEIDFEVESNFTDNLECVGQAGGYCSRGFARLGKRTAFLGYVGDDFSGRFIREELGRDGIDMSALFVDPAGTSRSVNFMYGDGRRKNFYDGKGHMELEPDLAVCREVLAASRLAHFHLPNWARHLLPVAADLGLTISCDLQDVAAADDPYRKDFVEFADILFFSAANHGDPAPLIEAFLAPKPDRIVIAGMGSEGCALGTSQGIRRFPALDGDEPVVDTNGAGDALAVGFLASRVLDGFSLEESVLRGQIAARYACARKATSSDLVTPARLEEEHRRRSSDR